MKSRETNHYIVKKEGEKVQTLAHGLAQGQRLDLAAPGLGLGLGLAGDSCLFVESCIRPTAITPKQFSLFGHVHKRLRFGAFPVSICSGPCVGTPTKSKTSGGPRPGTLCLCDTGPSTPLKYAAPN